MQFPVLLLQLLNYEKKSSNWKAKYDGRYRDEEVKKAKRLEKDQEDKVVYDYKSDQKREVNYIATKIEKDQAYKNVYHHKNRVPNTVSQEKKGYSNTASSQITFSRNVIIHINDDGQYVCILIYLSILLFFIIKCTLVDYPLTFFHQFLL